MRKPVTPSGVGNFNDMKKRAAVLRPATPRKKTMQAYRAAAWLDHAQGGAA